MKTAVHALVGGVLATGFGCLGIWSSLTYRRRCERLFGSPMHTIPRVFDKAGAILFGGFVALGLLYLLAAPVVAIWVLGRAMI